MRSAQQARDISMLESLLAEWGRGDFWNAVPYAEDVVFVVSGPDAAEYRGIDGLTRGWRGFLSAWSDLKMEGDQVVAGDPDTYVMLHRLRGRGKGSGMDIDADVATLVHMRDGSIARLEMFWDREAALSAAGAAGHGG